MNCRRCKAENPETSRYCSVCGALMPRASNRPKTSVPWPVYGLAATLVVLVAAYFFIPGLRPAPHRAEPVPAAPALPADASSLGAKDENAGASSFAISAGRFSFGTTLLGAPAGIESALVNDSWAALPLWTFLGPGAPRLSGQGASDTTPAEVDWSSPDPLVLCRFDLEPGAKTPTLAAYDVSMGLEWRPLKGERTSRAVEPGPLRPAGSFKAFALFPEIEAPGVLIQQGRIVGWTFGDGMACGYLWSPELESGPQASLPVQSLVSAVHSDSRETAFVQALAMPAGTSADLRLKALADGFRGSARLSPDDLPGFLKPAAIAALMSSLTASMVRQERSAEAARILDPEVLAAASDVALIKAAAEAYGEARGFDAAHRLLADVRREHAFQNASTSGMLDAVEVDLAKSFLRRVLNERGTGGFEIFEEAVRLAPDDNELKLLGVETAILEKKWIRAEELLRDNGAYPDDVSDKVRTLERLVEEGRREEDSVTIRFNPGDKLVPVYAVLNKRYRQKFFIDTGSTSSVIPSSAASALQIRLDDNTPVVGIRGVAGADLAYTVQLESIEVEGLIAYNLDVVVYDLGQEENAGLLGNDFLRNFQVDLDSLKGVLKLRKK